MSRTGTKEWSDYSKNFIFGCIHNCRYCYQKARMKQLKMIKSDDEWKKPRIRESSFKARAKRLDGRIMHPSTHDILPEFIGEEIDYLRRWLEVGNDILITSKPHYDCIKRICGELRMFRDQIVFRFTIGSNNDDVLGFWEPGAPGIHERMNSLIHAYRNGFSTSVSCEPFLDQFISSLVWDVKPFVSDSIWIGKMNNINSRIDKTGWTSREYRFLNIVIDAQTDEQIWELYNEWKDDEMIRWKDSIKKVVGLPEEPVG